MDTTSLDMSEQLKPNKTLEKVKKEQQKLAKLGQKRKKKPNKEGENIHIKILKSNFQKYQTIIFISIAILFAIFIRLHYASMPLIDDWAMQSAVSTYKPNIIEDVNTEFPYYDDFQKQKLIDERLTKILKENKKIIDKKATSLKESYKDPNGQTYIYNIDPYYYYNTAKTNKNDNFLSFISYHLQKFISIFNKDITLMQIMFYIPLIFVCLTIIPLFFITKRFAGDFAALIASILFSIHPEFLKFSLAGIADTNTLNVFFIVIISWIFIELISSTKKRLKITYGFLIIILIQLFKFTWSGYYLIIALLVLFIITKTILHFFNKYSNKIKFKNKILIIFSGIILLTISFLSNFNKLLSIIPSKIKAFLGLEHTTGIWPDSYSSIIELKDITLQDLSFRIGGKIIAIILIIFIFYTLFKIIKSKKISNEQLFCVIAIFLFLIPSLKAIRILPFSIPFICILVGVALTKLLTQIKNKIISSLNIEDKSVKFIVIIILSLILIVTIGNPFLKNYSKVNNIIPRMDDSIYNSAIDIKKNSDNNTKIFTWWDKGHFYNAISDQSTFLSASPQMPRTYWQAKALDTDNEDLSKGIIRMIACNGDKKAINYIKKNVSNLEKVNILEEILKLNYTQATEKIKELKIKDKILKFTHCAPPKTFIITTEDMYRRFHTVQKYADWNFENNDDEETYKAFKGFSCIKNKDTFTCQIEKYKIDVNFKTNQSKYNIKKFIYVDNKIIEFDKNNESDKIMIIYKRDNMYKSILVDEKIANSMYVNLMILKGINLNNFKLIGDYSKPERSRVMSYELIW
jgi:asparagine N-glycosylation enzyme membrane subunit Stt3